MNKKGQVLVLFIICIPIMITLFSYLIEVSYIAYKTIIAKNYSNDNLFDIINMYKDNDIDVKDLKIDNSLGYNISFKTSIPSLLGKLINKSSYDININITGVKENGKIKYQRG
jgi:hypothetical protein